MSEGWDFFTKLIGIIIVFLVGLGILLEFEGWGKIVGAAMVVGSLIYFVKGEL